MKITFLGTAGSLMTENKSFPSILINNDLLLDCGEGCTQKLLQLKAIDTINTICISHLHGDHFSGFFSLIWYYWLSNRTNDLIVIGPPQTLATTEKIFTLMNAPGFETFNFKIQFKELTDTNDIQEFKGDYEIKCAKMDHAIISYAYRVEKNGKSVCYSGDTRPTNQLIKLADNCDVFICESTFPDKYAKFADDYGHSTPSDVAKMARDANCQKLVLVHLYPLFAKKVVKSKEDLKEIFNKEILIADDLLILEI